tara:strand:+ start:260 stop:439 length:180 start_codon:yes stop_codon:yes gene_type:complete
MFTKNDKLTYNDGREGHTNATATVLESNESSMVVQFDDRYDTTTIRFNDAKWMDYITKN